MSKSSNPSSEQAWRHDVIHYISTHPDRPQKAKGLAKTLAIDPGDYPAFRALLREMLVEGTLTLGAGRTLRIRDTSDELVGVFRANRRGFGFVEVPGRDDLFVPRPKTSHALDGDTVVVKLYRARGRRGLPHAEVIKVVERAALRYVGVLETDGRRWWVSPEGRAPAPRLNIQDPGAKGARAGDLVVVEPLEHTLSSRSVQGVIVERLGDPSDSFTRILGVIRRYDLPHDFPYEVRQAAHEAIERFDPDALDDRTDLRDLLTITIDPPDARDFDDAISLKALDDGGFELGVHIADVAHFVTEGSPLDIEAYNRANSTYFPGYVVPMLPEVLSNGVCSLQPNEPRLTKSVFITYDKRAHVRKTRFANAIIRSRARLTYEQASAALAGETRGLKREVVKLLKDAETLAKSIRARRVRDGMISLAVPEVSIRLDENGDVADAGPADTSYSHTIIEMFMVEANEAVARCLTEVGLPHLRRVHDDPDPADAGPLLRLVESLGYSMEHSLSPRALQHVLDKVRGAPEEVAVNFMLLRSLSQACYSPELKGHFALASEAYSHFTSPIRRYPDLVNHRMLNFALKHQAAAAEASLAAGHDFRETARHTSLNERRSEKAEREARTILLLELMKTRLGETFEAIVTGVTSFGVFCQLQPLMAEGLIPKTELGNREWRYDAATLSLIATGSGLKITLGQKLRVQAVAVDDVKQELMLRPVGPIGKLDPSQAGGAAPKADESRRPKKLRGRFASKANNRKSRKKSAGRRGGRG